ncbi:MAG: hypothetical protein WCF31_12035 [Candidatus Deferrimicrobiaceae bacterium]
MKRLFSIASVMLLFSAIFFVAAGAGADMVSHPTHGMWTGTDYLVGPCPDTSEAFLFVNIGQGVMTHIGKSKFVSVSCASFDSPTSLEGSGWMIVTASNGDTIHVSIEFSNDLSVTPIQWTEHELIVGGTGRFEGATGESYTEGTFAPVTDPFPFGESIPPGVLQPPSPWIGTTEGWIMY